VKAKAILLDFIFFLLFVNVNFFPRDFSGGN
jgi:hypothetical protein